MKIHERLRILRKNKNLLQKDVAEYLNISKSAYGYYEQGRNEMDTNTLIMLSELYCVSVDYLLCRTDNCNELAKNESDIINMYRELDEASKGIVYGAVYALHAKESMSVK